MTFFVLTKSEAPQQGQITTSALRFCSICDVTVATSGGPGDGGTICAECATLIRRKKIKIDRDQVVAAVERGEFPDDEQVEAANQEEAKKSDILISVCLNKAADLIEGQAAYTEEAIQKATADDIFANLIEVTKSRQCREHARLIREMIPEITQNALKSVTEKILSDVLSKLSEKAPS